MPRIRIVIEHDGNALSDTTASVSSEGDSSKAVQSAIEAMRRENRSLPLRGIVI